MAKSGQYTRGKRVAMQVTLGLVLAGTAGLAALVSRQRAHDSDVELAPARRVGRLLVRLPVGWQVNPPQTPQTPLGPWATVQATGPTGRTITVEQEAVAGPAASGPGPYVALKAQVPTRKLNEVWMVERVGYVAERPDLPMGVTEEGETIEGYVLFAGTVLPPPAAAAAGGSGKAVGVMVTLKGPGSLGPSAKRLLLDVAENLSEAPADGLEDDAGPETVPTTATAPATTPSGEGEEEEGDVDKPASAAVANDDDDDDDDAAAAAAAAAEEPRLVVRPAGDGDAVEVRVGADGTAVLHVTSAGGIGQAEVRSDNGRWPPRVVVRLLQFRTLEGFNADDGKVAVHGSFGGGRVEVRRLKADGTAEDLPYEEKYAMPIRQGEGAIEVTLPAALYGEGADVVRIQWIDAYRG